MKKITLFVASLMLATSATKASEIINFSDNILEFGTRFNQSEPIYFNERGIEFFIFPNGEFDFNTRPNCDNSDYYYRTAGRRSQEVNNEQFENYGVRIEQDNFGRIRRIGNTFINYDFQDRVSRIGSVFLRYNRFALVQVGGLQLVYNRFGELVDTFGSVKSRRGLGFTSSNYSYYGSSNNVYQSNSNVYYRNNNNNNFNNDESQPVEQNADNNHYYYRTDGSKAKIEDTSTGKKEENPAVKTDGRR